MTAVSHRALPTCLVPVGASLLVVFIIGALGDRIGRRQVLLAVLCAVVAVLYLCATGSMWLALRRQRLQEVSS